MLCDGRGFLDVTKFTQNFHMITCLVTNHCNAYCDVCIESCGPDLNSDMLPQVQDKIIKTTEADPGKWLLSIQGGEPLTRPEIVKKLCDSAHKVGNKASIVTNGFWGKDQNMIDFVNNELKPDFMVLSIDEWHQKFVDLECIDSIIENVKNPKILLSTIQNLNEFKVNDSSYKIHMKLYGNKVGRGANVFTEPFKKVSLHKEDCLSTGFRCNWDGTVTACCPNEKMSCFFGNILELDLNEIARKLIPNRPQKSIEYIALSQYCLETKNRYLEDVVKK